MLLVRLMLVMAPAVFAINAATKGNVIDALLFATSVAVGITPQMLPVIVTTSLSQGAKDLARRQVIVKELPAIQNLGAMDVLCCDKTGTLTEDRIVLERYLNTDGNEDARVLRHAFLNSFFQTGLKNLIDLAVIDRADVTPSTVAPDSMLGQSLRDRYTKVDEVPFDFSRRRLSVVVSDAQGKTQMVTKGAAEEMLEICSFVEVNGIARPLAEDKLAQIRKQVANLNAEGLRVIAVAQKTDPRCVGEFGIADECDMVLMGFLAFLDPPKASAAGAVATLEAKGVAVKVLTGDNDRVPATVCEQIGIDASNVLLAPRSMHSTTPSLPSAPRKPTSSPSSRRCRRRAWCASCASCSATPWALWATASTTPPPCVRAIAASRSIRPSTLPRNPPISSCFRRTWACSSAASSKAAAPTATCSSTSRPQ